MTKLRKTAISVLALASATCLASSAVAYAFKDDKAKPSLAISNVNRVNASIDNHIEDYFDSNVVYKLPETVASDDEISVIVKMDTQTVLQSYNNSNGKGEFSDYASSREGRRASERVSFDANQLIAQLDKSDIEYTLGNRYDTVMSGFEVNIKAKDFERLDSLLGPKSTLIVGETYNRCETEVITNDVDVYETGIFDSSSSTYQGDGVVVAVLDTGLDYTHSAFSVENFKAEKEAFSLDYVSQKISQTSASKRTANLTGSDVYVSRKVPYAYDYADSDPDVFPINSEHGTHVAGIIAGKDDTITGVAPDAQLAIMKVFSDTVDGARTSWLIAALEDCVILGVDIINMSLGTACGFSREVDKENINVVYDSIYDAGISLIAAASNDGNATSGSDKNGSNGLTTNPDSGTVGSPSTYKPSLSVASVDGVKTPYLMYGDDIIYFTEASNSASKRKNFVDDILKTVGENVTSHDFEYVTIPGVGRSSDYMQPNEFYKGKIVLVKRGTTTFEDKVRVALNEKGAAGIIIYNNISGTISMSVGKDIGAVCSISQDEGEKLAAAQTGILKISKAQTAGPFMSDFSSWGPTSDLKIKPEITAHGGEILSAVPGQRYDRLSGTSMASPNQAGATALIRQYVKYSGTFGSLDAQDKQTAQKVTALVNQLMMSTADIVYNKNGLPYAVRKQGAGLVNITKSYTSASYITTYDKDGAMDKTKIELGDDKNKTGVYEMTFDINNVSSGSVSYDIGSLVITEGVSSTYTGHGDTTVTQDGRLLDAPLQVKSVAGGQQSGNTVTVPQNGTAKVTVVITLSDADKKYLDTSFAHGMYVEGFITLKAKSGTTVDMNIPLLAYYGDWTEAPIFDEEYYDTNKDEINAGLDNEDKLMPDAYATRVVGGVYSDYITTLGTYYFVQDPSATQIAASKDHIAISNYEDGEMSAATSIKSVWAGLLRNCKTIYVDVVEDATGFTVFSKQISNVHKSYTYGITLYPTDFDIEFAALANQLKNNTRYTVTSTAYIDYGEEADQKNVRNTFTFPLFIDFEAPVVTDVTYRTEYDRTSKKTQLFADLSVYDNHYAMGLQVGQVLPIENRQPNEGYFTMDVFGRYITPIFSSFNSTSTVTIELTDYISRIKQSAGIVYDENGEPKEDANGELVLDLNNNSFVAVVYDYALNAATYELRVPDEVMALAFTQDEIKLSPNETLDLSSPENDILSIYPLSTWSQVLDFKSSDPEIATVINQTLFAKKSGTATITASGKDANGNVVSASVTVKVLAEGEEGYVGGYSVPESQFKLTGYTTNKAYHGELTEDRQIGETGGTYSFGGRYSLSMFPSESVTLNYDLSAYFPDRTAVTYSVGNERIATVDSKGTIVAQAEGTTIVFLNVTLDGEPTFNSASVNITVKDPFTTSTIYLNAYKGLGGEVIVPDDRGITTIASYAFSNYEYVEKNTDAGDVIDDEDSYNLKQAYIGENTITKVVIPEGVEEIQGYAFAGLTALKEVVLPKSLRKIGMGAFMGCTSLTTINLENVQFINREAFYACTSLTSVALDNIVAIGDGTFQYCKLKNLVLPVSAQSLGMKAFAYNTDLAGVQFKAPKMKIGSSAFASCGLISIDVNASVISASAFYGCVNLSKVNFGKDVSVIGEYAFAGTSVSAFTLDKDNKTFELKDNGSLLFYKDSSKLALVAPAYSQTVPVITATEIADGAFAGNTKITSVIAENAVSVGNYAFAGCTSLTSIHLPKVEDVGDAAFFNCTSLTTFSPDFSKIKSIGMHAFDNTRLKSVTIADDAVIGEYAFANIYTLENVVIGNRVKVGDGAFYQPIDFDYAFLGTAPLLYLNSQFERILDSYYVSYKYTPEGGSETHTYYRYDYTHAASAKSLISVTIGDDCVLGIGAFQDNAYLETVILGENAVIGEGAFYNCFSLTDIDLSKVLSIGNYAFTGTQTCDLEISQAADGRDLVGPAAIYVYVDGERVPMTVAYSCAGTKLNKADISSVEILGTGAFAYNENLTEVKLSEKLTEIPAFAFADTGLTEIKIPAKVAEIGAYAFRNTALEQLDLSKVSIIGSYAFFNNDLNKVVLNAEGSYVGGAAFAYNYDLATVENLNKAIEIGSSAFVSSAIEEVSLDSAIYVGTFAFAHSKVKSVTLSSNLIELGENPFMNCEISTFGKIQDKKFGDSVIGKELVETYDVSATIKVIDGALYQVVPNGLELITYPALKADKDYTVVDGTVRISSQAFAYSPIRNVTLPKTLKSIGDKAFYGCTNLATVVFTSFEAPMLEEAADTSYAVEVNLPLPNRKGIINYNMWNTDGNTTNYYYGANFVDYIGSVSGNVVMVKPSNGTGYDTFIFDKYFETKVIGKAAATAETLAVIEMISRLPNATDVTLAHETQIIAVRNAYDQLSVEQQSLVDNYSRLTDAEGTLAYIKPVTPDNPTEEEGDGLTFAQKYFFIGYIIAGLAVIALVTYIVLDIYKKKSVKSQGETAETEDEQPEEESEETATEEREETQTSETEVESTEEKGEDKAE